MKEYNKYLNEVFNTNAEIVQKTKDRDGYYYKVNFNDDIIEIYIDDTLYKVKEFDESINSFYEISFGVIRKGMKHSSMDIFGNSLNPLKTFGVVVNVFKKWLNEVLPDGFYFTAKEPSRIKLYNTFSYLIQEQTEYEESVELEDFLNEDSGIIKIRYFAFIKK